MFAESIILGILQGLTEYLPISSSAHLVIIPYLFNFSSPLIAAAGNYKNIFDVALHFGTTLSTIVYFRKDLLSLVTKFLTASKDYISSSDKENKRDNSDFLLLYIVIACIPAGIVGLFFDDFIESTIKNNIYIICVMLISVSVLMFWAEKYYTKKYEKEGFETTGLKKAFLIGCAQTLALIPGTSRSGITIIAGIFLKLKREDAARFSFLLSTPVIIGASLYKMRELLNDFPTEIQLPFISGVVVSFIIGLLAIHFLLKFLRNNKLHIFAIYRILLAIGLLLFITL